MIYNIFDEINAAQDELERISVALHDAINASQRSWIKIGELLEDARSRQSSNQEFGKWCDEQGFGLGTRTLHKYRLAYGEYSVRTHESERLTDYNAWSRIASLKEGQKAQVLEKLKALEKPTRKDVEAAIAEGNGQALKKHRLSKADLERGLADLTKNLEQTESRKKFYDMMVRKIQEAFSLDNCRLIRSCLHPDREAPQERKHKAFLAFDGFMEAIEKLYLRPAEDQKRT